MICACVFVWRDVSRRPNWHLAGVVGVITAGLVLLVAGEDKFDLTGFLLVMSASAMSGVRFTLTQVSLHGHEKSGAPPRPSSQEAPACVGGTWRHPHTCTTKHPLQRAEGQGQAAHDAWRVWSQPSLAGTRMLQCACMHTCVGSPSLCALCAQ